MVFGVSRAVTEIGKTEVLGNIGTIKVLKNRITGQHVFMEFILNNNVIVPFVSKETDEVAKNDEDELVVQDLPF